MLVLTRRRGESILIFDETKMIKVTLLQPDPNWPKCVRLGIEAPKDITILREEKYDPEDPFNKKASNDGEIVNGV